jgi:LuxR family transcriptional regulator, maltose regulon positive regulatory protein
MKTSLLSLDMGSLALRSRQRRIIERPRLLRALDSSEARVRTIVASAGYGKTTLAEQWTESAGRRTGWFRARTSASDVAVIAHGLVDAAAAIVPGAGRRLLERLPVTQDPDSEAQLLAEMLAVDLVNWPEDGWIVVDDYHLAQVSEAPEIFVETLVRNTRVQLLLVGRERPRWVSSRDLLYGDVLEIGRTELAMTVDEIEQMLGAGEVDRARGLLALADGWPAVVALSCASGTQDVPPSSALPDDVFGFFAAEVFRRLDEDVQEGLSRLALLPLIDAEVACLVLGEEPALAVMTAAVETGIMDVREGRWELHPLAASFLQRLSLGRRSHEVASAALGLYLERSEWDSAFAVSLQLRDRLSVDEVFARGSAQLLLSGRLGTLEGWLCKAQEHGITSSVIRLREAELALRHGRHLTALTVVQSEINNSGGNHRSVAFELHATAARAAHVGAMEHEALAHYGLAFDAAESREQQRTALEGRLMCAATLELPIAHDLLEELRRTVNRSDPSELVRLADRTLSFHYRFGRNSVAQALPYLELNQTVEDPFTRVSFLTLVAWGLVLASDYDRAADVASKAVDSARKYRVDVTLPWVLGVRAMARGGLRQYSAAHTDVDECERLAVSYSDQNAIQNAYALRVRLMLQEGRWPEAVALEVPDLGLALPFMLGELWASRALALAVAGRHAESAALRARAAVASNGVETQVLVAATSAVCAARTKAKGHLEACERFVALVFESNATDPLITAVRSSPELLAVLLSVGGTRERVIHALRRAGDEELSNALCVDGFAGRSELQPLTAREREVHDLVCEGLTNLEVARRLFLTQGTVKTHLHHVYDKLGIRSRAALIANAAIARQAASAADVSERTS